MKDLYIIKDRLNEALKAREMTPQQLADKSGLYFTSIYRYLNGERIPKTDSIEKMATALNVSPSWLLGYDVPMSSDIVLETDELTLLIEKLSPQEKATLKTIVETLVRKSEEVKKAKEVNDNADTDV